MYITMSVHFLLTTKLHGPTQMQGSLGNIIPSWAAASHGQLYTVEREQERWWTVSSLCHTA